MNLLRWQADRVTPSLDTDAPQRHNYCFTWAPAPNLHAAMPFGGAVWRRCLARWTLPHRVRILHRPGAGEPVESRASDLLRGCMINGQTLITWGYKPGSWFAAALAAANEAKARDASEAEIRQIVARLAPGPTLPLRPPGSLAHLSNISAENDDEIANIAGVERHMQELMRVPTVRAGAVMPDACPSGHAPGTIPVGGVIAAENAIHPGMHSADICCSMAVSIFSGRQVVPTSLLDAGMKLSHFGGGGRSQGQAVSTPHA